MFNKKITTYKPNLSIEESSFIKSIKDKDLLIKTLFDNNPNLISVKNEDLTFALCNDSVLKFYGLESEEDIIGKRIEDINAFNKEEQEKSNKIDSCILNYNSKITLEEEKVDCLNNRHFFKTTRICFVDKEAQKKYLLIISNDITEDKEREQIFRQSHDFFTSFLDAIPAYIFLMKEDARYVYINKRARETFGINSQKYIGKNCPEIFYGQESAKEMHQDNLETIISGSIKELTESIEINGEKKQLASIKMPFNIAGKKYLIAVKFDDFDKRIKEFHDILLTDMEKQMFFSMSTFISGVTHEFRTPLQSIVTGLELIKSKKEIGQEIDSKFINIMHSSAENISNIINNLMHFGMAKGHYQDGEDIYKTIVQDRKKVNLHQLITETIDVIKLATLYKEHMQNGKIIVIGDPNIECWVSNYILRNILINLINNSIKAIVVRNKAENGLKNKVVAIRYYFNQEDIIIEVEDNGIGIQREMTAKLFSPFFRVNREIPGIGIGLFISKFWATSAWMSLDLKESQYGKTIFIIKFKKHLEDI